MVMGHEVRKAFRAVAGPMLAVVLIVYFGLNAFQGDNGVLRIIELRADIERAEHTLDAVSARREHLEARLRGLRGAHLDPDFLDERARLMTGFVRPNDIVLTGMPRPDPSGMPKPAIGSPGRISR